jgi:hypothetical protein
MAGIGTGCLAVEGQDAIAEVFLKMPSIAFVSAVRLFPGCHRITYQSVGRGSQAYGLLLEVQADANAVVGGAQWRDGRRRPRKTATIRPTKLYSYLTLNFLVAALFMSKHLVITNCTSRKRQGSQVVSLPIGATYPHVESLATAWRSLYSEAPKVRAVRDLYLGRSFSDAKKAALALEGDLYVISSGLGVAHERDDAPSYDLTTVDATNPLALTLAAHQWTPATWWQALNKTGIGHGPLATLGTGSATSLMLIALPLGYLGMITPDLLGLPVVDRLRLRIFSSSAGVTGLHPDLQPYALPYDDRLESISGHAGTRTDFPQRALRHFVQELQGHLLSLQEAKSLVALALNGRQPREIPRRTKLTDLEITVVLRQQWRHHKGNSAQLLRHLRQEAQIACEQKRFQGIWQSLKAEYSRNGVPT